MLFLEMNYFTNRMCKTLVFNYKNFIHDSGQFFASCCLILFLSNCSPQTDQTSKDKVDDQQNFTCVQGINELKRGDILVKPNLNFLPGTAAVPDGISFGHAAIVTEGYRHNNLDTLLSHAKIIESVALNIHPAFQIREISVVSNHPMLEHRSFSFGNQFAGKRYRLRLNLEKEQIDSIVQFALAQKGDLSSWNAMKSFPNETGKSDSTKGNWADNHLWYCSLLVWQAVYYSTSIDLDINKGFQVYPNDLIANPIFNNSPDFTGRARF